MGKGGYKGGDDGKGKGGYKGGDGKGKGGKGVIGGAAGKSAHKGKANKPHIGGKSAKEGGWRDDPHDPELICQMWWPSGIREGQLATTSPPGWIRGSQGSFWASIRERALEENISITVKVGRKGRNVVDTQLTVRSSNPHSGTPARIQHFVGVACWLAHIAGQDVDTLELPVFGSGVTVTDFSWAKLELLAEMPGYDPPCARNAASTSPPPRALASPPPKEPPLLPLGVKAPAPCPAAPAASATVASARASSPKPAPAASATVASAPEASEGIARCEVCWSGECDICKLQEPLKSAVMQCGYDHVALLLQGGGSFDSHSVVEAVHAEHGVHVRLGFVQRLVLKVAKDMKDGKIPAIALVAPEASAPAASASAAPAASAPAAPAASAPAASAPAAPAGSEQKAEHPDTSGTLKVAVLEHPPDEVKTEAGTPGPIHMTGGGRRAEQMNDPTHHI